MYGIGIGVSFTVGLFFILSGLQRLSTTTTDGIALIVTGCLGVIGAPILYWRLKKSGRI